MQLVFILASFFLQVLRTTWLSGQRHASIGKLSPLFPQYTLELHHLSFPLCRKNHSILEARTTIQECLGRCFYEFMD